MDTECRVNIYITTSIRGPARKNGGYGYVIEFIKKDGSPITRSGVGYEIKATENKLVLMALKAALKRLTKSCSALVFTKCEYILSSYKNEWISEWKKNDWTNARGVKLSNWELWRDISELSTLHHQISHMEALKVIDIFNSHIVDVLPHKFKSDPEVLALSHAINTVLNKYFQALNKSMVISGIDNLSEEVLDLRAIELDIPYYTSDMDIETKRRLVKSAIALYKKAGTKASIRAVVQTVLGNGEVIEWDKFNGVPGSFKIVTSGSSDTEALQELSKIIKKIKNAGATLIAVERITDIKSTVYIGGLVQSVTIQSVR